VGEVRGGFSTRKRSSDINKVGSLGGKESNFLKSCSCETTQQYSLNRKAYRVQGKGEKKKRRGGRGSLPRKRLRPSAWKALFVPGTSRDKDEPAHGGRIRGGRRGAIREKRASSRRRMSGGQTLSSKNNWRQLKAAVWKEKREPGTQMLRERPVLMKSPRLFIERKQIRETRSERTERELRRDLIGTWFAQGHGKTRKKTRGRVTKGKVRGGAYRTGRLRVSRKSV